MREKSRPQSSAGVQVIMYRDLSTYSCNHLLHRKVLHGSELLHAGWARVAQCRAPTFERGDTLRALMQRHTVDMAAPPSAAVRTKHDGRRHQGPTAGRQRPSDVVSCAYNRYSRAKRSKRRQISNVRNFTVLGVHLELEFFRGCAGLPPRFTLDVTDIWY